MGFLKRLFMSNNSSSDKALATGTDTVVAVTKIPTTDVPSQVDSKVTNERKAKVDRAIKILSDCANIIDKELKNIQIFNDDYQYPSADLTLKEQREFLRTEKKNLDELKDRVDCLTDKLNLISRIIPLINTRESAKLKYISELGLKDIILQLKNEICKFICEYNECYKYVSNGFFGANTGLYGEDKLEKELLQYRDRLRVLSNIRLEVEGTTVENDSIVIAETGVFCIEVKNYGAFSTGSKLILSPDGLWKRINDKKELVPIDDITSQVYRHIGITQRFVNEHLRDRYGEDFPYIPFHPLIIIANNNIDIDNQSNIPVLRVSNAYHYISTFKSDTKLDARYWDDIDHILNTHNRPNKAYPVKKCADIIINNYIKLAKKIIAFEQVNNALNIESNLINAIFTNDFNLIEKFKVYSDEPAASANWVNQTDIICLRAYIEQLYIRTGIERDVFETMIKYYFNVSDISALSRDQYEYISECFIGVLRRI